MRPLATLPQEEAWLSRQASDDDEDDDVNEDDHDHESDDDVDDDEDDDVDHDDDDDDFDFEQSGAQLPVAQQSSFAFEQSGAQVPVAQQSTFGAATGGGHQPPASTFGGADPLIRVGLGGPQLIATTKSKCNGDTHVRCKLEGASPALEPKWLSIDTYPPWFRFSS